ncbi:phosphotransferase [Marinicellulosiphila megalodicopiae]|uniref:phosphotransferase n=1 Tax=Marinicellulosiphila megalodicopiae TaxID=2724896 RepID=UPI003BB219FB
MKKLLGEGFYGKVFLTEQGIVKEHKWENMAKLEARHLTLLSEYVDFMHAPLELNDHVLVLRFQTGHSYQPKDKNSDTLKFDIANKLGQLHQCQQAKFDPWFLINDDSHLMADNWPEHYLNWLTLFNQKLKNVDVSTMTNVGELNTPNWVFDILEAFITQQPSLFAELKHDLPSLIHGDPSADNTIVEADHFVGLIDPFESGFYHAELDLIYPFQYDKQVLQSYMDQFGQLKGNWPLRLAYMAFTNHVYHHFLTGWWDESYMLAQAQVIKDLE